MKISEGSTEEVAKGGSRVTGAKGERALDYLTFFAQDWRMNIMFLLNHDIHMGIYLFIDIAHFLGTGRTVENEPCLFLIFSFIISTVCTSMHIIYMEQGRYRELLASLLRFFVRSYFSTSSLSWHFPLRVLSSQ